MTARHCHMWKVTHQPLSPFLSEIPSAPPAPQYSSSQPLILPYRTRSSSRMLGNCVRSARCVWRLSMALVAAAGWWRPCCESSRDEGRSSGLSAMAGGGLKNKGQLCVGNKGTAFGASRVSSSTSHPWRPCVSRVQAGTEIASTPHSVIRPDFYTSPLTPNFGMLTI